MSVALAKTTWRYGGRTCAVLMNTSTASMIPAFTAVLSVTGMHHRWTSAAITAQVYRLKLNNAIKDSRVRPCMRSSYTWKTQQADIQSYAASRKFWQHYELFAFITKLSYYYSKLPHYQYVAIHRIQSNLLLQTK